MKRTVYVIGLIAAVLLLSAEIMKNLSAEQVMHHGFQVEVESKLRICMSCHDGSVSHGVRFCTAKCAYNTPHSVLKKYPLSGDEKRFAPAKTLRSSGIKLVKGMVTCVSCHNLKNPEKAHLVMDNKGSKLCLTCHIK